MLSVLDAFALNSSTHHFLDHLRIAGGVQIVDKILRGHSANRLRHAVAVAVIDDGDGSAVHGDELVIGVIAEGLAAGSKGVSVGRPGRTQRWRRV